MKKLFTLLLLASAFVNAQNRCQATEKLNEKLASDPIFRENHKRFSQLLNVTQTVMSRIQKTEQM